MQVEKNIGITRFLLYFINVLSILLTSFIIYKGNQMIAWEGESRGFLENVSYLPLEPNRFIIYNFLLLIILFGSIYFREKHLKTSKFLMSFFFFFDIVICVLSVALSSFSYKGIILIAVINLMIYNESNLIKYILVAISLIGYILLDYDILSVNMKIISLTDYINYLDFDTKIYVYSFKSMLNSLNHVLFIAFMSFSLQKQVKEKQKIEKLYTKLIDTTRELSIANKKLEDYAKKSEEMAKIQERNRLAREIHDTIGHSLTGIVTGLDACKTIIDIDLPSTKSQIAKIAELARKGLIDIRRSVKALRPDSLERYSLVSAIKKMVTDISDLSDIKIDLYIEGQFENMNADEEDTIFRTVQEGITNAMRHGKAKNINISLKNLDEIISLIISDNGLGKESIYEGFGLKHIRERIEMLTGEVEFFTEKDKGFTINAVLPVRKK